MKHIKHGPIGSPWSMPPWGLRYIPNAFHLPKNGPERTQKGQKWPKSAKKGWLCSSKFPPSTFFLAFSPNDLAGPSTRFVFDPKIYRGSCFHGDMTETFRIFSKNFNFFTDTSLMKAIAQNCAQTKGPTIKMNKTNFEVHGLRTNLHLLILI